MGADPVEEVHDGAHPGQIEEGPQDGRDDARDRVRQERGQLEQAAQPDDRGVEDEGHHQGEAQHDGHLDDAVEQHAADRDEELPVGERAA